MFYQIHLSGGVSEDTGSNSGVVVVSSWHPETVQCVRFCILLFAVHPISRVEEDRNSLVEYQVQNANV